VCVLVARPVAVSPLFRQPPPSTRHCAPAAWFERHFQGARLPRVTSNGLCNLTLGDRDNLVDRLGPTHDELERQRMIAHRKPAHRAAARVPCSTVHAPLPTDVDNSLRLDGHAQLAGLASIIAGYASRLCVSGRQ